MLVSASFYSKILWIHVPSVRFAVCRITFSSRITTDLPTTSLLKLLFTGRSKMTKLLQKMNCYHWIRTFLKCGVKMPSFAKNCASTADPIISTEQAIGRHTWSIHAKLKEKDTKLQVCHSTVMIIFLYFSPTFPVNIYEESTLATVPIQNEMHVTSHCSTLSSEK